MLNTVSIEINAAQPMRNKKIILLEIDQEFSGESFIISFCSLCNLDAIATVVRFL